MLDVIFKTVTEGIPKKRTPLSNVDDNLSDQIRDGYL